MTIYSLNVLFLFGISLLFNVQFIVSCTAFRFLKRRVRSSGIPITFRIFHFIVIHTVKGFGLVNKAEIDDFSRTLLLLQWCSWCWQFDLWFLWLFENHLNIWNFMIHVSLKPGLQNFEHYFTSVWDEYTQM